MPQGSTLAGLGSAGALVGAVATVAAVAAGVVGFTAWPTSPSPVHGPAALSIGTPASGDAQGGGEVALPSATAVPTPVSAASAATAIRRGATARGGAGAIGVQQLKASGGRVRPDTLGSSVASAKSQGAPQRGGKASSPLAPVVAATGDAARRLGSGVASGGAGLQDVAVPVTTRLGGTLGTVAGVAGTHVRRTGDALARLLGELGGGPGPTP